jgi:hypothetical protein
VGTGASFGAPGGSGTNVLHGLAGVAFPVLQMEKGAEMESAPLFLPLTSILSIPTGVPGQLFQLYFPRLFSDLPGKSSKAGLDKILARSFQNAGPNRGGFSGLDPNLS